jgi:hypothetical protein
MEERTKERWKKVMSTVLMTAVIGFATVVTVWFLPRQISVVTDFVEVEGTVIETPRSDTCGESRCFYADVRYPDEAGNVWVRRMRVPSGASVGDTVAVRLPQGDPSEAATQGGAGAWIGLFYWVVLGPILLVGAGWEAIKTAWRRLRRIGEA